MKWKLKKLNYIILDSKTWRKLWLENENLTWSSFTTINMILNTSLCSLKVLLNKRVCLKILLLSQIFNTLPGNYLAVISKQRFNHGKFVTHIFKISRNSQVLLFLINLLYLWINYSLQIFSGQVCLSFYSRLLSAQTSRPVKPRPFLFPV